MNMNEQTNTIENIMVTPKYRLFLESCQLPVAFSTYREHFLKALRETTPEVLRALRDEVFEFVTAIGAFNDGPHLSEAKKRATLLQYVDAWGKQFHLNDPWLHEAAELTLYNWHADPTAAEDLLWAGLPDISSQLVPFREQEMRIPGLTWCVGTEGWVQFKKRATHSFNEHLKAYKASIDAKLKERSFQPVPKLRENGHFRWLALYQVRAWSPKTIATDLILNDEHDITESGVLKAVRAKARLIGLTLRPNRRGAGKKRRIVVPDRPRKFGRLHN